MKSEPSTDFLRWKPLSPLAASLPIGDAISEYQTLQRRRFHVPAHAGYIPPFGVLPEEAYRADLSEVEGLDVLSEPDGCIAESQAQLAALYGVAHSFLLVNGASVGLTAAMLSAVKPGEKVLLPRNVHRSVLSGLILTGAEPVWMLPERLSDWGLWGEVSPHAVEKALQEAPDIKALWVSSPTYEGLGSDIPALAKICRAHNVLLIVDEAHGGLWRFSERLPTSACQSQADAVIHSLHKSAGSLTQGALAHLPHESRMDPAVFQQALNTLQTTSPSYLLLRDMEAAAAWLGSPACQQRLTAHLDAVEALREQLGNRLAHFKLFEPTDKTNWDPCKLYLTLPGASGEDWGARMEQERRIAYESTSPDGVLYLANIGLQADDFAAFEQAFVAEEQALSENFTAGKNKAEPLPASFSSLLPEMALLPREAFFAPGETVSADKALGRIAKETVVHCPPGIPILMPGERIQAHHVPMLPECILVVR